MATQAAAFDPQDRKNRYKTTTKRQGRQKDIANGKIKYVNRKAIAFGQLFTLETALDIYDKGFITPKCSKTHIRL